MTITRINRFIEERSRPPVPADGNWPTPKIHPAPEFPFKGLQKAQPEGYAQSAGTPTESAIVIDVGASTLKVGWSFDKNPRYLIPPLLAKYKDRKYNKYCAFVGYDTYADATTRGQIRNAFEAYTSVPVAWDVMEGVLDYTFIKLGVTGEGSINRPIVMTEPVANLGYTRRTMNELLFEGYGALSVSYGLDSLFSYRYNKGSSGLVISSGHAATHVIPVLDQKPQLHSCARLNWGGSQAQEYLMKLIRLKFPHFPARLYMEHMESFLKQFAYMSTDYQEEITHYLDWKGLEAGNDIIIQYPFTEQVVVEKSAEEIARQEERKKESGRRLQEQAAKMRLDKLVKKEQDLLYYENVLHQYQDAPTKKEQKRILDDEEFKDEAAIERMIKDLKQKIQKSRNKDLGNPADEETLEEQLNKFPLLDVPDDQLDEDGIKEKRHQRLMKSGVEARIRAKQEKEKERARIADEKRRDEEHRINHPSDWIAGRRAQRSALLVKIKEQARAKADSSNRKGLASQARMKTLANLASDGPKRKRRGGGDYDDDFGANDEDWGVYRSVAKEEASDDEEPEPDPEAELRAIEKELLEYDTNFTENDTLDAQNDWTKSLMHAFLRGPLPGGEESQREMHQLHLNVERIRVPEVIFQPSIAGVDQAGIVEIVEGIVMNRFNDPAQQRALLKDVFLTGGNTLFKNFEERLKSELTSALPTDFNTNVRAASDPVMDAWRGAATWWAGSSTSERTAATVSKAEYSEKGSDYIKVSCASLLLYRQVLTHSRNTTSGTVSRPPSLELFGTPDKYNDYRMLLPRPPGALP